MSKDAKSAAKREPVEGTSMPPWTISSPDGRVWIGDSPLRAAAAAQRDTIDPVLAMQRINAAVAEEHALWKLAKEGQDHSIERLTERYEALEAPLEALVNRCNQDGYLSASSEVIAAEAALERLYKDRIAALAKAQGDQR